MRIVSTLGRCLTATLRPSRAGMTLGQLRSDLSHETASKIARLLVLAGDWRRGRYRERDFQDASELYLALASALLKYARPAAASIGTWCALLRAQFTVERARALTRQASRRGAFVQHELDDLDHACADLRTKLLSLVDGLSRQHGERIEDLVIRATDEVRIEMGAGQPPGHEAPRHRVSLVVNDAERVGSTWVPRRDVDRWIDLFRNLLRNAAQAVRDRQAGGDASPGEVAVRFAPLAGGLGTTIEVADDGIGMHPSAATSIWKEGEGSHGRGRGKGLTEEKLKFLQEHASLNVESQPGAGTRVQIGIPVREIELPPIPLLPLRPAAALLAVVTMLALGAVFLHAREDFASTEVRTERILVARGAKGNILWERNLGEVILDNLSGFAQRGGELSPAFQPREVLHEPEGAPSGVIVSTIPDQGSGALSLLDTRTGAPLWEHRFRNVFPSSTRLGRYVSRWQSQIPWSEDIPQALAVNVRDQAYSPNAIQIMNAQGVLLASYFHFGNLALRACADFDRDGRIELLLYGISNGARNDSTILGFDPHAFVDCLILLELPFDTAQAFPYRQWPGIPPAMEEGYLLIPPLARGERGIVHVIDIAQPEPDTPAQMDIRILDGRIYRTDARLRPLGCSAGDDTPAQARLADRDPPPVVYVHHGRKEMIATPLTGEVN